MKAVKKLKKRGGFSLAETLVAILILLLVSAIVAAGVPVARNAYEKVVLSAKAQTLLSSAVSALRDELGTAWDVRVEDSKVKTSGAWLTYYSSSTGARTKLYLGDYTVGGETFTTILVQDNVQEVSIGTKDLGTPRQLVQDSNKGGMGALYVTCEGTIGYENGEVTFTDLKVLTVGGTELAKLPELTIRVASSARTGG